MNAIFNPIRQDAEEVMVERESIVRQLKQFIAEDTSVDVSAVNEDTTLRDDLGLDSVDLVAVVMRVEEQYGIRLTQDDMKDIVNVRSVVDLILSRLDKIATPEFGAGEMRKAA